MKHIKGNTVTFAIIGCGDVTEKKSGPAFQKVAGSRLKTVMRRDEAKLRDYAARHRVPHYTTDYLEIINDPEIDAVYIATPPSTHCFYTLEAARHGKAVYVEKPMAMTVDECRQMVEACDRAGVPLFTAYYRRGMEKFITIKHLIDGGKLGEIQSVSYQYACPVPAVNPSRNWLMDPAVAGGGMLYDVGSHMVDTLRFLFGEVGAARGSSANTSGAYGVNDDHSFTMAFESGLHADMRLCFCAQENRDEAVVQGAKGSLRFAVMDNGPAVLTVDGGAEEIAFRPVEHVQQGLITRVVDTLLGKDHLESRGEYGLRTQEILEAIDRNRPYRKGQ